MKFLILGLIVCLAGLGFYLGWFDFGADNSAAKSDITFTIDKDKIQSDAHQAKEKVQDLGHQANDKAAAEVPASK